MSGQLEDLVDRDLEDAIRTYNADMKDLIIYQKTVITLLALVIKLLIGIYLNTWKQPEN